MSVPAVATTGGLIEAESLGFTFMHEHIFCVSAELQSMWPGFGGWDEDVQVTRAAARLKSIREQYGVQSILDPTVGGIGRQLKAVARVAAESGINILVCTGWYTPDKLPFTLTFHGIEDLANHFAKWFTRDLEVGMEGTEIRAAALKCCIDHAGVTPNVEAVLRAVGRAHFNTGAPITTHTEPSLRGGLELQDIFTEEGVDLGRVVIGHVGQSGDVDYMERLISAGSYVGFDRCGRARPTASLERQLDTLVELISRGYADRIVIGHDDVFYSDTMPVDKLRKWMGLTDAFPYGYIHSDGGFLSGLRQRGVAERDIQTMFVDNPRTYFSGGTGANALAVSAGTPAST